MHLECTFTHSLFLDLRNSRSMQIFAQSLDFSFNIEIILKVIEKIFHQSSSKCQVVRREVRAGTTNDDGCINMGCDIANYSVVVVLIF